MNPRYANAHLGLCFVCSARQRTGDECRFKNIRVLNYVVIGGVKNYTSAAYITADHTPHVEQRRSHFDYPISWNESLQSRHSDALKVCKLPHGGVMLLTH